MVSLYTVPPGGVIGSQDTDQLVLTLTGQQNTPVSVKNTDPIAYTLQLQNTDAAGKTLLLYGPDGTTVILRSQGNGVVASPDGTAAAPIVTTTHAQTLTNKTLTAPLITSLQVQSGNLGIGVAPSATALLRTADRSTLALVGSASGTAFPANLVANGAYQNLTGGAITLSLSGGLSGGNVYVKGAISMTVNAAHDFFVGYSYNGGATVQVAHHTGTGVNSWVTIPLSFGITSALTGTTTVLQLQVKGTNADTFAFDTANAATVDVYEMR